MRKPLFLMAALALFLVPSFTFAQDVETDNWRITVEESQELKLNFAIEYIGDNQTDAATTVDVDVDTSEDTTTETTVESTVTSYSLGDVLITEFVSDPVSGEDEWVELYNASNDIINLADWLLVEGSGMATSLSTVVTPGSYVVVSNLKGGLNNVGDEIALYDPDGNLIDQVTYGDWTDSDQNAPAASDPESVGRTPDGWAAMTPSPGTANTVTTSTAVDEEASDETGADDSDVTAASETTDDTATNTSTSTTSNNDTSTETSSGDSAQAETTTGTESENATEAAAEPVIATVQLANIRDIALDTQIVTEGIVTVVPDILGKQYFYIGEAGAGVQVYLYSAEFPPLSRGMRVRAEGILSQVGGERRLKLISADDLTILGTPGALVASDISSTDIGEGTEGQLVRMTGMLTESSSGQLTISDADGDVRVVIKAATGIATTAQVGDQITVTGIVSQTSSGYRLLPRDQQDLLLRTDEETEESTSSAPALAGVTRGGGSTGGSAMLGWLLSAACVLTFAGLAGRYAYKKKQLMTT